MSKVPGPWYLKGTTALVKYHELKGTKRGWIHGLHLKYGPVVQIGRNEVSCASYTAAKQIYSSGNKKFRKTELYNLFQQDGHINLFTALDPGKHSEIRRALADRYSNSNVLRSKIMEAIAERAEPKHHDKVTKLHDELANASPDKGLETLPYLGAVVQEALRLWAPGTLPLPRHVSSKGAYIDGYYLPGNTIVESMSYSMHRVDTIIFPEAEDFVPERWLKSDGHTKRQRMFSAFGLGPRTCIGKQ
ncbi:putative sterigmatocystin biosynthesis P450 monooxygenase STCB-like protein 2 [Colletotrichum chlorophyti]|uniref:Putative sterigmatocystin biosynthesis P450 monooxygenase STCB-like protein 2 n=1 Tax=Colletotrichum chlorophyti TaxID=708187 RepID=A0A1Q8S8Z0_9PEZI|nr:putative sterigmatocystin biosynthesis P450 monooxygenase STCB-like protein 2 [Colletotrichum chlorophyti]